MRRPDPGTDAPERTATQDPPETPIGSPRRYLWLLPLVAVLAIAGLGLFRARPDASLGRPAPAFRLPTLAAPAEFMSPASLRGRPAVINFWASWCDPCREEAPSFARAAGRFDGEIAFLGINVLDGREEALAYVEEFSIGYPNVRDADGRVSDRFGVTGVPETVFLDARGTVVGKRIGAFGPGELEALVSTLTTLRPGDVLTVTGRGRTRPVP